jgi:hypothetical protein
MSRQKDLKRLVRGRMQKTGESYTTARLQLLKKTRAAPAAKLPANYAELAGMSDDAVKAKTGRTWPQWLRALDALGAADWAHRDIARHLHHTEGLSPWWSQMVSVGYERLRGLRELGQKRSGSYELSKSKTLPVDLSKLYRAFSVKRTRDRWLEGASLKIRRSAVNKSMRIVWEDGTKVDVAFHEKAPAKSQVVIQHKELPTRSDRERLREYWGERLGALAALLKTS